jgi:hypothetical protein
MYLPPFRREDATRPERERNERESGRAGGGGAVACGARAARGVARAREIGARGRNAVLFRRATWWRCDGAARRIRVGRGIRTRRGG